MKEPSRLIRDEIVKTINAHAPLRWTDLLKKINDMREKRGERKIGRATLSTHLKTLEKEGKVKRIIDKSVYPPAVYYELVDKLEEASGEIISLWQKGKLRPWDNPWNNRFYLFFDTLDPEGLPVKTLYTVRHWLSNIFAELEHVFVQAHYEQLEKTISQEIWQGYRYYKANREYVKVYEERMKKHGIINAVDETEKVLNDMFIIALKHIFKQHRGPDNPAEYLEIKNGKVVGLKRDQELRETMEKQLLRISLKNAYPWESDEELEKMVLERIQKGEVHTFKNVTQRSLLKHEADIYIDLAKDSGKDCSQAPPLKDLKDLRYYAVWLQNKLDPRVFTGFPLLPQELKEYEYLKERLKEAEESYKKVTSHVEQPINVLITAKIPIYPSQDSLNKTKDKSPRPVFKRFRKS